MRRRERRAALARGALLAAGAAAALAIGAPAATAADADEQWRLEAASPLNSKGRALQTAEGWWTGDAAFTSYSLVGPTLEIQRRTAEGWHEQSLVSPAPEAHPRLSDATADLSRVIVTDDGLLDGDYDEGIYLHEGGTVTPIATYGQRDFIGTVVEYIGGSDDKRTLYLWASPSYASRHFAESSTTGLYRWADGTVTPINVDFGRPATCSTAARPAGASGGASGGPFYSYDVAPLQNGISADGKTIVISSLSCVASGTTYPSHLYVVRDGAATMISRPLPGERDYHAQFVGMSRDARRVFFTSQGRLLADDEEGVNALYLWEDGRVRRLTADPSLPADGAVVSSPVISPDGSTIYFQVRSGTGADQRFDLYVWRNGEIRHVVKLAQQATLSPSSTIRPEVSYDGSALLLPSRLALFDGIDPRARAQLYRVGIDGTVACISCRDGVGIADAYAHRSSVSYPSPQISRDGSTIAFVTSAALVDHDTNGWDDVYVWHDGKVTLLSSGTVDAEAIYAGMAWDGRTVFFQSWGALIPGTSDEYQKLYAARRGDAIPPPAPPVPCGADCQGPLTPAPFLPVPGSETYAGAGNVKPAPTLTVQRIGAAAQRRLARGGKLTVVAHSSVAATIRADLRARLGSRWVRVARTTRRLAKAGTARLQLALSARAKRYLARRGALRVEVLVASSAVAGQRRASFVLRAPKRARASIAAASSVNDTAAASRRAGNGSGRDA